MATSENVEESSAVDILLTEESILNFLLSKSGEVKNAELVRHFRSALKTGRHRAANVQQFPRFVNNLATVRVDANGRKIVTLKHKYRHQEDAVTVTVNTLEYSSNGGLTASDADTAATDAPDTSRDADNIEPISSKPADSKMSDNKKADRLISESETDTVVDKEQTEIEDNSFKETDIADDDNRKNAAFLANDETQTHPQEKSPFPNNKNLEETEPANEETITGDRTVDENNPEISYTSKTNVEERKKSSDDELSGNVFVEEKEPANKESATEKDTVESNGLAIPSTTRTNAEGKDKLSSESESSDSSSAESESSSIEETSPANVDTLTKDDSVESGGGHVILRTSKTKIETKEKKSSVEKQSSESETQPASNETADDEVDRGLKVLSSEKKREQQPSQRTSDVSIVVEDHSSVDAAAGEVDDQVDFHGVKQLAQRIDEVAQGGTRTSALLRTKKQARSESMRPTRATTGRPTSTVYDYSMNDVQREWTLRASYSDYQELSKLLSRHKGLASRRDFITGYSALHWAAKNGRADVVKLLLGCSEPPDVDSRSHGGYTALHVAAMNSRHAVIELLVVVYKADADATDFAGHKPIYYLDHDTAPSAGKRSSALLRSEMLLTPRRGAVTSTPRKRPLAVKHRRQSSSTTPMADDSDSDRPAAIQSLISLTQTVTSLMLPPRDLPAVVRRRPVTTRQDSHSDSETTNVQRSNRPNIRPAGSTSDIVGTVI